MTSIVFQHPEPLHLKTRVWPVFMPFMGCPTRCIYCAQTKQTGTTTSQLDLLYNEIINNISAHFKTNNAVSMELAFYGGTFTAIPFSWQVKLLKLINKFREKGWITKVRCSTRPDCIKASELAELKGLGLDLVELGVQSFDSKVLKKSGRNYNAETVLNSCNKIKSNGLELGVQLLPGLPDSKPDKFQDDILKTIELNPDVVRIYPCLTVKGTGLAKLYEAKKYEPWSLEDTTQVLSDGLLSLWENGINVIRIGVAPEPSFETQVLAGPVHPAIGQIIRSKALFSFIKKQIIKDRSISKFKIPKKFNGEIWGHKGNLKGEYNKIGILPELSEFYDGNDFQIDYKERT